MSPPKASMEELITHLQNVLKDLAAIFADDLQQMKSRMQGLEYQVDDRTHQLEALQDELEKARSMAQASSKPAKDRASPLEAEWTAITERLRRLEREISKGLHVDTKAGMMERSVAEDRPQYPEMDYFLFEERFRGTRESIKERQRIYVDHFKGKNQVVDLGCGRGEFVELLRENGIGVIGVDINDDMIAYNMDKGLPVVKMDLLDYLNSIADASLDGIFSAQVIEHLRPDSLLRLIHVAHVKLGPMGVLLLETINPQTWLAVANAFYMDLSHIKPIHPLTLQFIMEATGFKNIQIVYSNPASDQKLPPLLIEGATHHLQEFNQALERVNHWLYGPQDYAVVCIK